MSLLPVAVVVAVWTMIVFVRWRRAVSGRRARRQWEQAVATLDAFAADRGSGPYAGQVWCRTVGQPLLPPASSVVPLLPVQRTAPEPAAPAIPELVASAN